MCFKIVHHLADIPFDMFFKFAASTSTREHPLKLLYPDARMNARAHAFPVRIVSLWNRLPANIVLPANLKQFKWQSKTLTFRMHLLVKIEFKNSSIDMQFLVICVLFCFLYSLLFSMFIALCL